jgi:hypothetical protein
VVAVGWFRVFAARLAESSLVGQDGERLNPHVLELVALLFKF